MKISKFSKLGNRTPSRKGGTPSPYIPAYQTTAYSNAYAYKVPRNP